MQSAGKKRRVSTCISCYNRKQKCNRRYPCNHCTRRRRPEECVYNSPPPTTSTPQLQLINGVENQSVALEIEGDQHENQETDTIAGPLELQRIEDGSLQQRATIIESFGYFEDSNTNTLALLKLFGLNGTGVGTKNMLPSITEATHRHIEQIPPRQVLDFLVQYFISNLNWMKQLVHAPSFLMRYQQWWIKDEPLSVPDIEFLVLILRICLYSAHFLPSSSHTVDQIGGLSLPQIRNVCAEVGESIAKACLTLDRRGSLVRVQHLLYAAITFSCEGRRDLFWEGIASASQAAQKAGIHKEHLEPGENGELLETDSELEKEMRRRVFCCLYILDSHLSRQLDRVPFLPENLVAETLPRMYLAPEIDGLDIDSGAPDTFTERLMQVRLAMFWDNYRTGRNIEYDPTQAEERYEKLCAEFIPLLPPAFALVPDTKWDRQLPQLPMQRQLLHIGIFDSVCWNFRPLLMLKPSLIASIPPYKRVLLQAQKKLLAIAALKELEAISTLHSMFNGCHTRFGVIIFHTFEAAVLLLAICTSSDFSINEDENLSQILGLECGRLTQKRLFQAIEKGLKRLQKLAEVSQMAASGARTLSQLFSNASRDIGTDSLLSTRKSGWHNSPDGAFPDALGFDYDLGFLTSSNNFDSTLMIGETSRITGEDTLSDLQLSSLEFPPPFNM